MRVAMRWGCPLGRQPAQSPDSKNRGRARPNRGGGIRRRAAHSRGESLGHFPAAGHQRPDARQRLRRRRARLHDGLRHHPAHQLRARRGRDDRRDGGVLRNHRRSPGRTLGLPPLAIVVAGVLVAIPVCMGVGYTLERVAYRPLRKAPRLAPLITAIGAVDHPAAPRDDHLEPQSDRVPADHHRHAHPPHRQPERRDDHQRPGRDHRHVGADDGRAARARLSHEARHRDARDVAEPAGGGPDGHQHQHGDRAHLRDRRRTRRDGRRDGRHLLRHRAIPDGLHPRAEGVLGRRAGRHRQPRGRDAGRRPARADRGARRGLCRRSHQPVPDRLAGPTRSRGAAWTTRT